MYKVREPELIKNFKPIKNYDKFDKLDIKEEVKKFTKDIIFNNGNRKINSGSIALLSKFGSGKSFFMQYLFCYLYNIKKEQNIPKMIENSKYLHPIYPVYIDISKYENNYDKLLVLIFSEIYKVLKQIEDNETNVHSNNLVKLKELVPSALKVGLSMISKKFNKYEDVINLLGELGSDFASIILNSIIIEEEYLKKLKDFTKDAPLIILIDNLDRCRPEFVLDFFVLMKRMFNVENVLFIVAYDKQQIINLLTRLYGNEIDIASYLKKYISLEVYLSQDHNKIIDFANNKINKSNKIEQDIEKNFIYKSHLQITKKTHNLS